MSTERDAEPGVWAVCDQDYGETITTVHEDELSALRAINGRGYGRVRFVPFGVSLNDLDHPRVGIPSVTVDKETKK